jgi:hypothetical protein
VCGGPARDSCGPLLIRSKKSGAGDPQPQKKTLGRAILTGAESDLSWQYDGPGSPQRGEASKLSRALDLAKPDQRAPGRAWNGQRSRKGRRHGYRTGTAHRVGL